MPPRRKVDDRASTSSSKTSGGGRNREKRPKESHQEATDDYAAQQFGRPSNTAFAQTEPMEQETISLQAGEASFKYRPFANSVEQFTAAGLAYFGYGGNNLKNLSELRPPRESAKLFIPKVRFRKRSDKAISIRHNAKEVPFRDIPFLPDIMMGEWSLENLQQRGWLLHDLRQHGVQFKDLIDRALIDVGKSESYFRDRWDKRLGDAASNWAEEHGGIGGDLSVTALGKIGRAAFLGIHEQRSNRIVLRKRLEWDQMLFNTHWIVDLNKGLMYSPKAPDQGVPLPPPLEKLDERIRYNRELEKADRLGEIAGIDDKFLEGYPNFGKASKHTLQSSPQPLGLIQEHERGNLLQYECQTRGVLMKQTFTDSLVIQADEDEDQVPHREPYSEWEGMFPDGKVDATKGYPEYDALAYEDYRPAPEASGRRPGMSFHQARREEELAAYSTHRANTQRSAPVAHAESNELYEDQYGNNPSSYGNPSQQYPTQYGQPSSFASGSDQQTGAQYSYPSGGSAAMQQQAYSNPSAYSQYPSYGAAPPNFGPQPSGSSGQRRRRGGGNQ